MPFSLPHLVSQTSFRTLLVQGASALFTMIQYTMYIVLNSFFYASYPRILSCISPFVHLFVLDASDENYQTFINQFFNIKGKVSMFFVLISHTF